MARPTKKKSPPKKAAKKPVAKKPTAKKPAATPSKPRAKAPAAQPRSQAAPRSNDQSAATPYTPKPIEGVGWPAFRYPLS
jgi:hypothetical protein